MRYHRLHFFVYLCSYYSFHFIKCTVNRSCSIAVIAMFFVCVYISNSKEYVFFDSVHWYDWYYIQPKPAWSDHRAGSLQACLLMLFETATKAFYYHQKHSHSIFVLALAFLAAYSSIFDINCINFLMKWNRMYDGTGWYYYTIILFTLSA